jgi:hypothetical protein
MKKLEYETMRAAHRAEFDAEHHAEFEELEARRECERLLARRETRSEEEEREQSEGIESKCSKCDGHRTMEQYHRLDDGTMELLTCECNVCLGSGVNDLHQLG